MLDMRQPIGDLDQRRPLPVHRVGQPHPVRCGTEPYALEHVDDSTSLPRRVGRAPPRCGRRLHASARMRGDPWTPDFTVAEARCDRPRV